MDRNADGAGRPARVLIVDDDPDLLETMAALLRRRSFEVLTATDAESALEAIARECPGVMLTDLRLPGQSGLDLLRTVRGRHPELPVLLMTAYGDDELVRRAEQAGAHGVLTKPVPRDVLFQAVGRALEARGS